MAKQTPTTFQQLSEEFYKAFEKSERSSTGEPFYRLRDGSPEWARAIVYDCHNALDVPPCDWAYEHIRMIASNLTDVEDPDDDTVHEIADGLVDCYTSALTKWASLRVEYASLVDEAQSEGLTSESATHAERLQSAQCIALQRMTDCVVAKLREMAEERDNAE